MILNFIVVILIIMYCVLDYLKTRRVKRFGDNLKHQVDLNYSYLNKPICVMKLIVLIAVILILLYNRFIAKDITSLNYTGKGTVLGYLLIGLVLISAIYDVKKVLTEERRKIEQFMKEEKSEN